MLLCRNFLFIAALLAAGPAFTQEPPAEPPESAPGPTWATPLEGVAAALLGEGNELGVLVVSPVDDEATAAVETLLLDLLTRSGFAAVVMDDRPLGDVSELSDDEILEKALKYPVDVVVVLRTFPAAEGHVAVMRVESKLQGEKSFRFRPGGAPPWAAAKVQPTNHKPDPTKEVRRQAREMSAMTRMGAVGVAESLRLVWEAEQRRIFTLEGEPKSPVIKDPAGEVVPWPQPYELMGEDDLAARYRGRGTVKTVTIVTGGVLTAAGIGALFVGLVNQANCSGGGNCGRPLMLGGGLLSLGLGTVAALTGVMLRKHPVSPDELQKLVEQHNASLE